MLLCMSWFLNNAASFHLESVMSSTMATSCDEVIYGNIWSQGAVSNIDLDGFLFFSRCLFKLETRPPPPPSLNFTITAHCTLVDHLTKSG